MSFHIQPITLAPFQPLFALDDDALAAIGARRMVADKPHSAPCRVSLTDAAPGERLILLTHRHVDDAASPYRSEGAVVVREAGSEADLDPGVVPDMLARRLLSARVYDADWMMTEAAVVEGRDLAGRLDGWFGRPDTAVVQLHTAHRGCFLATAARR